ncbi:IPT/TIG domain-containing protein [Curtobacterium sp. UCD-KPL2560]|uniref:phage tail tube protein n=1 Tax=Curtobacterium sp. UCD-KPL2560 TaxID=1885315 RepID=UPI000826906C|nr:IPT/TIG domain-containing protein [Curtobacterium sp. UCD-KPL2560]
MPTALARKFALQVTNDLTLQSGFIPVKGVNDLAHNINPNLEDASDYDANGWASSEVTMQDYSIDAGFYRRVNAGVLDPGQELIRACIGQFDSAARLGFRMFDKTGGPEAYSGVVIPTWKRSNTGVKNLDQVTATLTGTDVPLNIGITNPYQVTLNPVVTAVSPGGKGSGTAVAISGTGFTNASAVKFGATAATSFSVVSDQLITAILPTGSAGAAPVTVTTPVGTSNAAAYTRAA